MAVTLSAQSGPPHVEAAHLSSPCTHATLSDPKMSSNAIKAQTFITQSFTAIEEMLDSELPGE